MVVVLGQADKQIVAKDFLNQQKVDLMKKAVKRILEWDEEAFERSLYQLQRKIVNEDKLMQLKKERTKQAKTDDVTCFKFVCFKCDAFVCKASDIRIAGGAHHFVINPDFKGRARFTGDGHSKVITENLSFTHKMYCAHEGCNQSWGMRAVYNGATVPLLAKRNFRFYKDADGCQGNKQFLSDWNDVPFLFLDMRPDDLEPLMSDELN